MAATRPLADATGSISGKSAPVGNRETDDPACVIAWKHAPNPTPPAPRSPPRPHYPSRASASPKSGRPDLGRAE